MKLNNLKVGDKVYGWDEKRPYKVYYKDNRYIVIAKAMFGEYCHSIIDLENKTAGQGQFWLFGEYVPNECFKTGDITNEFKIYLKEMKEMGHNITGRNTVSLNKIKLILKE